MITGGNGNLIPGAFREATWARGELHKLGIPDSLILTESNSRNTDENATFSKKVLAANRLKPPYLLVTSAFHMRRSKMIFNKKGIEVIPYSCGYFTDYNRTTFNDLFPQADVLMYWELYLKEVVGYATNYFTAS